MLIKACRYTGEGGGVLPLQKESLIASMGSFPSSATLTPHTCAHTCLSLAFPCVPEKENVVALSP